MSLFQRSTLTFANAKIQVAEQASKQNTAAFLERAGKSIQQAFKYWNRYNWQWLMKQAAETTVSASASALVLPYDFKDVYDITYTANNLTKVLKGTNRRLVSRLAADQTPGRVEGYDLFRRGNEGLLSLYPPTDTSTALTLRYYRRMWVPCSLTGISGDISGLGGGSFTFDSTNAAGATHGSILIATATGAGLFTTPVILQSITESTTPGTLSFSVTGTGTAGAVTGATIGGDNFCLDVPEDYENGILSWATHHFLSSLGAPESRLSYFISLANDELERARAANEEYEDQDIAFELGNQWPTFNPRLIIR